MHARQRVGFIPDLEVERLQNAQKRGAPFPACRNTSPIGTDNASLVCAPQFEVAYVCEPVGKPRGRSSRRGSLRKRACLADLLASACASRAASLARSAALAAARLFLCLRLFDFAREAESPLTPRLVRLLEGPTSLPVKGVTIPPPPPGIAMQTPHHEGNPFRYWRPTSDVRDAD